MPITITNGTILANGRISGRFASSSIPYREPGNDVIFFAETFKGEASISGSFNTGLFKEDALLTAIGSISGTFNPGLTIIAAQSLLSANASISAEFLTRYLRSNIVGWSKIGDTRILIDQSNEAGYKPLPGKIAGVVQHILSLQDKYPVVYSTSGIYLMTPVSQPFATFGFRRISERGILMSGCVCGDEEGHYYIRSDKVICKITAGEPHETELGYDEFIDIISPNGQQVVMLRDTENKRTYISSTRGGYILTDQGLGGGFSRLTGTDGFLYASPVALTVPGQEIATDIIDFGNRGIKTIQQVDVSTDLTKGLEVAIDYRYDKAASFTTSSWKPCNKEGVSFPLVSGVEFRFRVRTDAYADFEIDRMLLRVKYSDKRYNRGAKSGVS